MTTGDDAAKARTSVLLLRIAFPVAVAVWAAVFYQGIADFGLSSALYPRILAGLMVLVVVPLVVVTEVRGHLQRRASHTVSPPTPSATPLPPHMSAADAGRADRTEGGWLRVLVLVLLLAAWLVLVERLGFAATTAIVYFGLSVTFMGFSLRGIAKSAVASAVFVVLSIYFFDVLLGVPMPGGRWG